MTNTTFTGEHLNKYLEENNLDRERLIEFTVPHGTTKIAEWTFSDCTSLTSIKLPDSLTTIGAFAFDGCTLLSPMRFPARLTEIGEQVFRNCTSLKTILLPKSLTKIGIGAFYGCTSIEDIKLPKEQTKISRHVFCGCTSLTSIELPESLIEIGEAAFGNCSSVTFINLPDSLTEIGGQAFRNCTSLNTIILPPRVSEIALGTFAGCTNLRSIVSNRSFDWNNIGIDQSQTKILSYKQYLEKNHASIIEKAGMHDLSPNEAFLIIQMINDQKCLPTWDTLKYTFQNRSTIQVRVLLEMLGKNEEAIRNIIPSIEITINDTLLHQSIFTYLSIKDCENIFDGTKNFNFIMQTKINNTEDDLSQIEREQNSVKSVDQYAVCF